MEMPSGMEQNAPKEAVEVGRRASIWAIVGGVFTAPVKAFDDYVAKPNLWIPCLLLIILIGVSSAVLAPYQAKAGYELMKRSSSLPAPALKAIEDQVAQSNPITSALWGAVMGVIMTLLLALLAWAIGSIFFSGQTRFAVLWGVTMLGGLIGLVGKLLTIPLVIAKNSIDVSFGLAALWPNKNIASIFYLLLVYLDAFAIWGIIVTGIGYAAVFKFTRGKGIMVSAIASVVLLVGFMMLQILGMSLTGVKVSFF